MECNSNLDACHFANITKNEIYKMSSVISFKLKYLLLLIDIFMLTDVRGLQCWTCENQPSNEACRTGGKIETCLFNQDACQNEVRREDRGMRISKRCKQAMACENNFVQNSRAAWDPTQCNSRAPSSVCRCCCSSNRCNELAVECLETKLDDPIPEEECLVIGIPQFGERYCDEAMNEDRQTFPLHTVCTFKCNEGYKMIGEDKIVCKQAKDQPGIPAAFSREPPLCQSVFCPISLPVPVNGLKKCSNADHLSSRCDFECFNHYTRVGPAYSTCVENNGRFEWDNKVPRCEPKQCNQQILRHGKVICSDPNNVIATTCTFQCIEEGYFLYPDNVTQNTCLNDTTWNVPSPCCTRGCPALKVDFVVVLDSSSSVGMENWKIMKRFVRAILEGFELGPNKANLAVFRYNDVVDMATQILLNDFTKNMTELLEAFEAMPYNGSGTKTGKALQHARDVLFSFENGNRPDVLDLMLVITDGRSQDEVAKISEKLREDGVIIYVLGVIPPNGQLDVAELLSIAGDSENLIIATGGFEDLNTIFSDPGDGKKCENPCEEGF